ncbi:hypothetical protein BSKO_08006 [Bryopsis sp. KO-2023]|nr:hypothetical protein BSKO_08006 [Bryopsis sp. KO-2023]
MSYADYGQYSQQRYPTEGNVLLCTIENQMYPVTVDALTTVFTPYGTVQKVAIFEKQGNWQALIQYGDNQSAYNAKSALESHAIYDGGYNRLRILYSKHTDLNVKVNNEKSWDYTAGQYHATSQDHHYASQEDSSMEMHVSGVDYERAHEEIARAAAAAVSGRPLPPSMVPMMPGVAQHQVGPPPGANPYAPPLAPGMPVHPSYAAYSTAPPPYPPQSHIPAQQYPIHHHAPPPQHNQAPVAIQQQPATTGGDESQDSVVPPGSGVVSAQQSEEAAPGQEHVGFGQAGGVVA